MEKSKINSFLKRLATTLVLVPVVVGCIINGYPSIYLLALFGAALLSWEWTSMIPNNRPAVYAVIYLFVAAVVILIESLAADAVVMTLALILAFYKSKGEKNPVSYTHLTLPTKLEV